MRQGRTGEQETIPGIRETMLRRNPLRMAAAVALGLSLDYPETYTALIGTNRNEGESLFPDSSLPAGQKKSCDDDETDDDDE